MRVTLLGPMPSCRARPPFGFPLLCRPNRSHDRKGSSRSAALRNFLSFPSRMRRAHLVHGEERYDAYQGYATYMDAVDAVRNILFRWIWWLDACGDAPAN